MGKDMVSVSMLLNRLMDPDNNKVLLVTCFLFSYFRTQAVQLAVHGKKLAVHLHCFATT